MKSECQRVFMKHLVDANDDDGQMRVLGLVRKKETTTIQSHISSCLVVEKFASFEHKKNAIFILSSLQRHEPFTDSQTNIFFTLMRLE